MDNSYNIYRLLRIARDMKVKDLAEIMRVTPAYINAIEKGERVPSERLIREYARALNVDEQLLKNFTTEYVDNSFERTMLKLLKIICGE